MELIKEQVRKVISYSQGIPDPQVDELIEKWYHAKEWFIQHFGGPIVEIPYKVKFQLDDNYKQQKVLEFEEFVATVYDNHKLVDFIELNRDTFFDNQVGKEGNYGIKGLKKGMKLVKAFKYFEENKEALDKIQSMASQIIQEDKIEGKLCFSVHPLDFLSSSCNTYNWRSCHALDGDYRAGNLSYMTDKTTMMVYVKGEDKVHIPMFPLEVKWNSKKWRVLWYVSPDTEYIFAGKQYPFESWSGMETAKGIFISEILKRSSDTWCEWTDPIVSSVSDSNKINTRLNTEYIAIRGELKPIKELVQDVSRPLHFNDVLNSSCYKPHYTAVYNYSYFPPVQAPIIVGSDVKCLCCGTNYINHSDCMMCEECDEMYGTEANEQFVYCMCCDSRIPREDAYWIEDDVLCEYCYSHHYFTCSNCDQTYHKDSMKYDKESEKYLCLACYLEKHLEAAEE